MSNMEVKMENHKEFIAKLKLSQKIVEESQISSGYKEIAFQETMNYLTQKPVEKQKHKQIEIETKISPQISSAKTFPGFLRLTKSKSHSEKTMSIAYFLMKQGKMTFTKEDIENAYQEAFLPKSKNTNVEITGLIKRGLLMSTKEKIEGKKSFQITMDGISFVETELIKDAK